MVPGGVLLGGTRWGTTGWYRDRLSSSQHLADRLRSLFLLTSHIFTIALGQDFHTHTHFFKSFKNSIIQIICSISEFSDVLHYITLKSNIPEPKDCHWSPVFILCLCIFSVFVFDWYLYFSLSLCFGERGRRGRKGRNLLGEQEQHS